MDETSSYYLQSRDAFMNVNIANFFTTKISKLTSKFWNKILLTNESKRKGKETYIEVKE